MSGKSDKKKSLVPRLRFPEFREAGAWEVKRLAEIGEIVTGTTPSTKKAEYYEDGIHLWVTPTDIGEEKDITETKIKLSEEGLQAGRFVSRNSLLVTCIASIGKNAILRM
ncbi:restriction endonuclease subunit S, partial [Thiolapillus sp.]